jgi:hypothetical protein
MPSFSPAPAFQRTPTSIMEVEETREFASQAVGEYVGSENIHQLSMDRQAMERLDFYAPVGDVPVPEGGIPEPEYDPRLPRYRQPNRFRAPTIGEQEVYGIAELAGVTDIGRINFQEGHSRQYWESLIGILRRRQDLERTIARADHDLAFGASAFGSGFVAMLEDPLNVVTAFIPIVGEARYARLIEGASRIGRIGIRAGTGAVEGGVGAAIVEPGVNQMLSQIDADYGLEDSLLNIASGAAFGAGLRTLTGPIVDKAIMQRFDQENVDTLLNQQRVRDAERQAEVDQRLSEPMQFARADTDLVNLVDRKLRAADQETRESIVRAAVNQLMYGKPVDVVSILDADPRVKALVNGFRTDDVRAMVQDAIDEVSEQLISEVDTTAGGFLSRADRRAVGEAMERAKRNLTDLTKERERLRAQSKTKLDNDLQWELVKKDREVAAKIEEVEDSLSAMRDILDRNKAGKEAKKRIDDFVRAVRSGEFEDRVLAQAQRIRADLLNVVEPTVSRSEPPPTRAQRMVDEVQEKHDSLPKTDDEGRIDAETEVIREEAELRLNEDDMVELSGEVKAIDDDAAASVDMIDRLLTCKVN